MKTRALFAAVIAMTMIACDEETNPMLDSGTAIDSGGPGTDSGMPPGSDSGPGTDSGTPGTDAGTPGESCGEQAQAFCEEYMECDAERFLGAFETMAICLEVTEAACDGTALAPHPDVPPLEDPSACTAAKMGSCALILGSGPLPEACIPPPGPRAQFESCSVDEQCGMGTDGDGDPVRLICTGTFAQLACGEGTCNQPSPLGSGSTCGGPERDPCNRWLGEACTHNFDDDDDGIDDDDDNLNCRAVSYSDSGGPCHSGTDTLCSAGLVCDDTNNRCMAPLDRDTACTTTRDLCDRAKGLTCVDDNPLDLSPDGHCEGLDWAPIGAQCGTFDEGGEDVTRICSAYAFCNNAATTVCEAKDRVTEPCSLTPQDTCWPGYECRDSTCMPPEPPEC